MNKLFIIVLILQISSCKTATSFFYSNKINYSSLEYPIQPILNKNKIEQVASVYSMKPNLTRIEKDKCNTCAEDKNQLDKHVVIKNEKSLSKKNKTQSSENIITPNKRIKDTKLVFSKTKMKDRKPFYEGKEGFYLILFFSIGILAIVLMSIAIPIMLILLGILILIVCSVGILIILFSIVKAVFDFILTFATLGAYKP